MVQPSFAWYTYSSPSAAVPADIDWATTHVPPWRAWNMGSLNPNGTGKYAGMTTPQALQIANPNLPLLLYEDVSFVDNLNTDGSTNQFYAQCASYNDETMWLHMAAPPAGAGDGTITAANRKVDPTAVPWWGGHGMMYNPVHPKVRLTHIQNIHNVCTTGKMLWNPDPSRGGLPYGSDGYDNFQCVPNGVWLDDFGNTLGNLNAQRGGQTVEYGTNAAQWNTDRLGLLQAIYNDLITIPDSHTYTGTKLTYANTLTLQNDAAWTTAVYQYAHGHMDEWQPSIVAQYSAAEFYSNLLVNCVPNVPVNKVFELADFQGLQPTGNHWGGPDNTGAYWTDVTTQEQRLRLQIAQALILQSQCPGFVTTDTLGDSTPSTMYFPNYYTFDWGATVGPLVVNVWDFNYVFHSSWTGINAAVVAFIQQFANGIVIVTMHDNDRPFKNTVPVPLPAGTWKDLTGNQFSGTVTGQITLASGDSAMLVPAGNVFPDSALATDAYKFNLSAPTTISQKVSDAVAIGDTFRSQITSPPIYGITYPVDTIINTLQGAVSDLTGNNVPVQTEFVAQTIVLPAITVGLVTDRVRWLVIGGLRKRHYTTYDVNVYSLSYQEKYYIAEQVKKLINRNRSTYAGNGFLWIQQTGAVDKDDPNTRPVTFGMSIQVQVIYDEVAQ